MKALFISEQTLLDNSVINENVSFTQIRPTIVKVQEMRIQPIVGSALYNELVGQVVSGTTTALNNTLLEDYSVAIPQGVKEGSKVRVAGKGEPGTLSGPPGELYLVIHIEPHPLLKREGDDLHMEVPVTVREAMAGRNVTIPTIDGEVRLKIPPGSQTGQTLKLKGKDAANPKTKKKGDLMVKLIVKVPKTEDKEILEAAGRMDRFYTEDVRAGIRL